MHHFDLLVFTKKATIYSGVAIANTIAECSDTSISCTVLLHKITELGTKQTGQYYFFDKVFREGYRLCIDQSAPPYLLSNPPGVDNKEADKAFWLKCEAVAQFNMQCAKESPQLEVALCRIALLHTACVQVALGLIRVCLGYTPNEFGLNHLLKICGHFTHLPALLFNQQLPEGQRRFKMLCAPPSMLNHWTRLDAKESDFLWLLDACGQFLDEANKLVIQKTNTISNP